jgi:hypothetical protein
MEKMLRLLVRTRRGSSIVLTLPESKKDACADWAMKAIEFDPTAKFAFEETSGRMLFDRLYDFFRGLVR